MAFTYFLTPQMDPNYQSLWPYSHDSKFYAVIPNVDINITTWNWYCPSAHSTTINAVYKASYKTSTHKFMILTSYIAYIQNVWNLFKKHTNLLQWNEDTCDYNSKNR